VQEVAQRGEEELVVRPLGRARGLPAGDEVSDRPRVVGSRSGGIARGGGSTLHWRGVYRSTGAAERTGVCRPSRCH
jgi:hypothetical protein